MFFRSLMIMAMAGFAGLAVPDMAQAQSSKSEVPTIAVMDIVAVMRESSAGKSIRTQLQAQRKVYREQIADQEKKLRTSREELSRQRAILSPDALQQRENELKESYAALERGMALRDRELRNTGGKAEQLVNEHVRKVIDEIASERGIDLVMIKNQLYYASPEYDITGETIKRLNKLLPDVDIKSLAK